MLSGKHAGRITRVEHLLLETYTADGYCILLQQLIQAESPLYVILPQTYQVAEFAPALATRFGQVLISDVIAIGGGPVFSRQLSGWTICSSLITGTESTPRALAAIVRTSLDFARRIPLNVV